MLHYIIYEIVKENVKRTIYLSSPHGKLMIIRTGPET